MSFLVSTPQMVDENGKDVLEAFEALEVRRFDGRGRSEENSFVAHPLRRPLRFTWVCI